MRHSLEPAYVLHARQYRESSLIVEAFTRSQGRVALVAKGARGKRSRWRSLLQPFRPLLLSWTQRGEMGTLTGADQVASPPALSGDALFCGLYANELMMRFNERADPHAGLFTDYQQLLAGLAAGNAPQPALRLFEKGLLESAGFGLQLEHEYGADTPLSAEVQYRYVPGKGAIRWQDAADDDHARVSGAALLALQSGDIGPEHLQELKSLMRLLIRFNLGDRDIRALSLFQEV
jgi:DNA repair protein RecO (recombination protein O)